MTFEPDARPSTVSDPGGSSTTGEPLLAVEGLSARYRTEHEAIEAVRNVSLEVRAGEAHLAQAHPCEARLGEVERPEIESTEARAGDRAAAGGQHLVGGLHSRTVA